MAMQKLKILQPAIARALLSALLFGAATPVVKVVMGEANPWLVAGLLYAASGIGLSLYRFLGSQRWPLRLPPKGDLPWLCAAISCGGIIGPVLLMTGLQAIPASRVSLLLNAEGVFTALIAWIVFHEGVDRRIALGMLCIVSGALLLSWQEGAQGGSNVGIKVGAIWPTLAVLGACVAWALDNNLTRKLAHYDATFLAATRGIVAGAVNIAIAVLAGVPLPALATMLVIGVVGCLSFGISMVLFVTALRELGAARTGAYFSVAPFFGALLALLFGEPFTWTLAIAGVCMGAGVWLHVSERHEHLHRHEALRHSHRHRHDEHHQHDHDFAWEGNEPHEHEHVHEELEHSHGHFPDVHHRHRH